MDLDSFVKVENVDGDPVADFIAREQIVFTEIDGDLDFVDNLNRDESNVTTATIIPNENIDINNVSSVNGDSLSFQETNGLSTTPITTPTITVNGDDKMDNHLNNIPPVENEKIKRWRSESVKILDEKDEEEAKRKQELINQAKQELQDWYSQHNDQLNRLKASNRKAEAEWKAERDAEVAGKEWEKIARMCDFNPKPNQKNIKDTSRMKSILLQLKQHPPKQSTLSS